MKFDSQCFPHVITRKKQARINAFGFGISFTMCIYYLVYSIEKLLKEGELNWFVYDQRVLFRQKKNQN